MHFLYPIISNLINFDCAVFWSRRWGGPPCAAVGGHNQDRETAASGGTGWGGVRGDPRVGRGLRLARERTPACALAAAFPGLVVNAGGP